MKNWIEGEYDLMDHKEDPKLGYRVAGQGHFYVSPFDSWGLVSGENFVRGQIHRDHHASDGSPCSITYKYEGKFTEDKQAVILVWSSNLGLRGAMCVKMTATSNLVGHSIWFDPNDEEIKHGEVYFMRKS